LQTLQLFREQILFPPKYSIIYLFVRVMPLRLQVVSFLFLSVVLVWGQEVNVYFKEEFVLDVAPYAPQEQQQQHQCPQGSAPLLFQTTDEMASLCSLSLFSENEKRRVGEDQTSSSAEQTLFALDEGRMDEEEEEQDLDISILIHLGLNQGTSSYNLTALAASIMSFASEGHASFQEYISLDVLYAALDEANHNNDDDCPQGYELVLYQDTIFEFSVCPFRLSYSHLSSKHPALGLLEQSLRVTFADFLQGGAVCGMTHGNQHILLDQEFLVCMPCFPGSFCPIVDAVLPAPEACPSGTYNSWYGKSTESSCISCPHGADFAEVYGCSRGMLALPHSNTSITPVQLFTYNLSVPQVIIDLPLSAEEYLEEQEAFQRAVSKWLLDQFAHSAKVSDIKESPVMTRTGEILHIILWPHTE
jgi:hypothetical protein